MLFHRWQMVYFVLLQLRSALGTVVGFSPKTETACTQASPIRCIIASCYSLEEVNLILRFSSALEQQVQFR